MPAGRPSDYTPEIAAEICQRIRDGELLMHICRDDHMPGKSSVFRWLRIHEEFRESYEQAREDQAYGWVEECFEIADENEHDLAIDESGKTIVNWEHINRSKLRIETRKWAASKIGRVKFGDRVTNEHTGPNGSSLVPLFNVTISQKDESEENDE